MVSAASAEQARRQTVTYVERVCAYLQEHMRIWLTAREISSGTQLTVSIVRKCLPLVPGLETTQGKRLGESYGRFKSPHYYTVTLYRLKACEPDRR